MGELSQIIIDVILMEPDKRNGGCGVIFNDKLYVWGGQTLDVEQPDAELELEEDDEPLEAVEVVTSLPRPDDVNHPFDVLDLSRMVWSQVTTSARHADKEKYEIPNLGLGSSLLLDPEAECFLLFGGFNELQFDAKVYRIFPGVWEWDVIEPSSDITPTPRYLAGVLIHNNRLCVFGGVSGPITDGVDYGATHVPTRDSNGALLDYGWNNEYFEMDLSTSKLGQQLDIPYLNLWEEKSVYLPNKRCSGTYNNCFLHAPIMIVVAIIHSEHLKREDTLSTMEQLACPMHYLEVLLYSVHNAWLYLCCRGVESCATSTGH